VLLKRAEHDDLFVFAVLICRSKLFEAINSSPTLFEVVTGQAKANGRPAVQQATAGSKRKEGVMVRGWRWQLVCGAASCLQHCSGLIVATAGMGVQGPACHVLIRSLDLTSAVLLEQCQQSRHTMFASVCRCTSLLLLLLLLLLVVLLLVA
jgi:hypothetical protein